MDVAFGVWGTETYRSWRTLWRTRKRPVYNLIGIAAKQQEWLTFRVNFFVKDDETILIDNMSLEYS